MMRTLLYGMFGLALIASTTTLTTTQALADPGENNGNHYGQYKNGNNGNDRSVPIPGTLVLFGAGFAGLVAWQVIARRKLS